MKLTGPAPSALPASPRSAAASSPSPVLAARSPGRSPLPSSIDSLSEEEGLLDQLQLTAGQVADQVNALKVTCWPSVRWLGGALGSSMLTAGILYTVTEGGSEVELRLLQSAAAAGAGMYFFGQETTLREAWAVRSPTAVLHGLCVPVPAVLVVAAGCLLGLQHATGQTAGAVLWALSSDIFGFMLAEEFVQAYGRLGHSAGEAAHFGDRTLPWAFGLGAVLMVLLVVWGAGFVAQRLHYTAALGTACAGAFSACLGSSWRLAEKLWELRQHHSDSNAAVASTAAKVAAAPTPLPQELVGDPLAVAAARL